MANHEQQPHHETSQIAQWLRDHGRLVLLTLALTIAAGTVTVEEGHRNKNDEALFWGTVAVAASAILTTPFLSDELEAAIERHQK